MRYARTVIISTGDSQNCMRVDDQKLHILLQWPYVSVARQILPHFKI